MNEMWRKYSREDIERIVSESFSYRQLAENLGYSVGTNSVAAVKQMVRELNLDISHFTSISKTTGEQYVPFAEYITYKNIANSKLSQKLIREGLKKHICECCKRTTWNDKPIPIELHHVDGDHSNNDLSNLQLLCPNCHAQTDNYCGKNTKRKHAPVTDEEFVEALKSSSNIKQALDKLGFAVGTHHYRRAHELIEEYGIVFEERHTDAKVSSNYCVDCGAPISKRARRCAKCGSKFKRRKERPAREVFKQSIRTTPFKQLAKQYGISKSTLRQWCAAYELPTLKTEIDKISDEEWASI